MNCCLPLPSPFPSGTDTLNDSVPIEPRSGLLQIAVSAILRLIPFGPHNLFFTGALPMSSNDFTTKIRPIRPATWVQKGLSTALDH